MSATSTMTASKTFIRYMGETFILEDLTDAEFNDLFDRVVTHGSDLVEEQAMDVSGRPASLLSRLIAENTEHLEALGQESDRRKGLVIRPAYLVFAGNESRKAL